MQRSSLRLHTNENISIIVVVESNSIYNDVVLIPDFSHLQIVDTHTFMRDSLETAVDNAISTIEDSSGTSGQSQHNPGNDDEWRFFMETWGGELGWKLRRRRENMLDVHYSVMQFIFHFIVPCGQGCSHPSSTTKHQFLTVVLCNRKSRNFDARFSTSMACREPQIKRIVHHYFTGSGILHLTITLPT